jgi:hypothetical protein
MPKSGAPAVAGERRTERIDEVKELGPHSAGSHVHLLTKWIRHRWPPVPRHA